MMRRRDLEQLIQRQMDGDLDDKSFEALAAELESSAESRAFYRHSVRVEQAVEELLYQPATQESVVPVERLLDLQRRRSFIQALSVAAVLLIGISLMLWRLNVPNQPANLAAIEVTPGSIHSLDQALAGGLEEGSPVRLDIGVMKLQLPGGTVATIEGPAEFQMATPQRFMLDRGKATFDVSPGDAELGFTVLTELGVYLDLGTRFGVLTGPERADQIQVYEGKVQAKARFGLQETATLTKGMAAKSNPIGRWSEDEFSQERYPEELPAVLPGIHFSFDEPDPLVPSGTHSAVDTFRAWRWNGEAPRLVDGVVGKAMKVSGQGSTVTSNWSGFAGEEARTVACWVKFDSGNFTDYAGIVSWGNPQWSEGKWNLVMARMPEMEGRVLRLGLGPIFFTGSTEMQAGEWYHVAVVFRGSRAKDGEAPVELFVNGESEKIDHRFSSSPDEARWMGTETESPSSSPFGIGRFPAVDDRWQNFFKGTIDELSVFPYALHPEAVKALSEPPAKVGN